MNLLILPMMRVLFSYPLKLKSYRHHTFTSTLQQILKQNHQASHNSYSVKNISKLLVFQWLLNELLLEIEWSEVMLIKWLVSIQIIMSFIIFLFFFNIFIHTIPFVISTSLEKLSVFHLQVSSWQHCFVYLLFFSQKGIIFFFVFVHFLIKLVKPKCKTRFSQLLKGYICYIFLI